MNFLQQLYFFFFFTFLPIIGFLGLWSWEDTNDIKLNPRADCALFMRVLHTAIDRWGWPEAQTKKGGGEGKTRKAWRPVLEFFFLFLKIVNFCLLNGEKHLPKKLYTVSFLGCRFFFIHIPLCKLVFNVHFLVGSKYLSDLLRQW